MDKEICLHVYSPTRLLYLFTDKFDSANCLAVLLHIKHVDACLSEVYVNHVASVELSSLASNLLTSNNYSFALNAIPKRDGEVVTDIYFDFGKVPAGFQSLAGPTLTVNVSGTAVNGYQLVNRADAGGKYQGTWQTATANWITIVRKIGTTPKLPKTGY